MRLATLATTLFLASSLSTFAGCGKADSGAATDVSSTAKVDGAKDASKIGAAAPAATALAVTAASEIKPLDKKKFGEPIAEQSSTSLASLVESPATYDGKTIRTEGRVTAVCQAMGCWMEIGDDKTQAHIKMAGHSFLVPKTASGHRAVVQGKVIASPQGDTCGAKDNCRGEAEKATGQVAKLEIEATGIEFVD